MSTPRIRWTRFSDDLCLADLPDGTRATVERDAHTWTAYRRGVLVARRLGLRAAKRTAETGVA